MVTTCARSNPPKLVDGGVIGPGWSGYEHRDFAAHVAAWLSRRETYYVIGSSS